MTVSEVRKRYLDFFAKRGHAIIPSAPIVPENDPTTLFTGSGMQPLVPYLLGQPHPEGTRLANSQLSFRAEDIEEVGDNRHTTFFEMLGNWSLGDYFKKEQLSWVYEFLTEELKLPKDRLWVTCFAGDETLNLPKDTESAGIWKGLGMPEDHICFCDAKKNWWSRSGTPDEMPTGELGGPDSEIFFDFQTPHGPAFGETCHPNCDCGRFVEIGNSVFLEYIKNTDGSFGKLPKQNVDFGGGLERLTSATNDNPDIFLTDVFSTPLEVLKNRSHKPYKNVERTTSYIKSFRIILDHIRAATFMLASGIRPSNTEQGYILRRLIRRSIREADKLGIKDAVLAEVAESFDTAYTDSYSFMQEAAGLIREELEKEEAQFKKTLSHGMRELKKMGDNIDAFLLFTTFGFPIELTEEIARERGINLDMNTIKAKMKEHQALSRAGAAQKFAGGLADSAKQTVRYHTATHLLLAALRKVLRGEIVQKGSNITAERLRFDFNWPIKLSPEQLKATEDLVNEKILERLSVEMKELPKAEAQKIVGTLSFNLSKYGDIVKVYKIGDFSAEFCGGPHVENTGELGHFRILKEEASSAGVRRIKAMLE